MLRIVAITLGVAGAVILHAAIAAESDLRSTAGATKHPCCVCGDPVCSGCKCVPPRDRHAQSGYGLCVAPWASLTYGPKYKSYYVGGSVVPWPWSWRVVPEPRFPWEGTWGRDFAPAFSGVDLWWSHGRLYQDGGGQYEADRRNFPFFLRIGKDEERKR